jgi:dTDP-4-dehydrorhamnose reductase
VPGGAEDAALSRAKDAGMQARYLVVGRNSFLAGRFRALGEVAQDCDFVTHREAEAAAPSDLRSFDCVVNFAIDPGYRRERYAKECDFDLKLAELVQATGARYVMASTRAVYSAAVAMGAKETGPATGNETPYGRNKLETERRLTALLGGRLTVLRIANIIGDEFGSGRRTFMSLALESLKSKNQIRLDIAPDVRRDFLPDTHFVRVLDAVLREPCGGLLNVGSGLAVRVGDIADWLIEGYGAGEVVVSDQRLHDVFVLDVGRLRSTYRIECTHDAIADHCRAIGRQLRGR